MRVQESGRPKKPGAFEKAWASVQTSGAIFETDAKAEAARAILARKIAGIRRTPGNLV
jgi:hypothetical protein